MTTTRILSFTMIALLSMALVACGDETTTETGLTCGEGTVDESGVCVPAETVGDLACGEGTVQDGSECVPDTGAALPTCGPGTKEVDGVCELDPDATPVALTCGEGTTEVDGECVADVTPAEPLAVSDLHVSSFEMKGPYPSAPTALRTGFPVSMWATIKSEANAPYEVQVLFGLTDGTNEDGGEGETCLLGARTLYHPGTAAEVVVGGEF
ncbi:MAG: hypothetical protein VYE15_02970, partial [Myxococcota bacterium]|nr:hypothetical protein [Myxococcota bacterium]